MPLSGHMRLALTETQKAGGKMDKFDQETKMKKIEILKGGKKKGA